MAVWGAARRLASFVISGRVCWMVFMVSCLLAAVERMGVSQVRRVCFSWSFFLLVGGGVAVGSYVEAEDLGGDFVLEGGLSGRVLY